MIRSTTTRRRRSPSAPRSPVSSAATATSQSARRTSISTPSRRNPTSRSASARSPAPRTMPTRCCGCSTPRARRSPRTTTPAPPARAAGWRRRYVKGKRITSASAAWPRSLAYDPITGDAAGMGSAGKYSITVKALCRARPASPLAEKRSAATKTPTATPSR